VLAARQAETSPGWWAPPHPVPAVAVPGEPSAGQRRAGKARETPAPARHVRE